MTTAGRTYGLRGGLLLAATALVVTACGADPVPPAAQPHSQTASTANPFAAQKASTVAEPVRVRIPSIGVDAPLVGLGLKRDGAMETPAFGKAGWYTEGPKPGDAGPAVIAGHVDSKSGPDVFAKLKDLKKGAKIVVTDKAKKSYTFVVERKPLRTDKDELPAKQIWGKTEGPALRLITCGGQFDRSTGHYPDNWTIFAEAS